METALLSSAVAPDAPRLSVGELFNAEVAQGTFQRLVDAINAQAAAVERLTRRVATLETTQRHAVAAQQHALQHTDAMVAQIETLQDVQKRAEVIQRNQQSRVDDLVLVVSRDARLLTAAMEQVATLQRTLETTLESLKHEMAPMALTLRYDMTTEMSRLDSVVAKIQAFAPTASQLSTRLGRVEKDNEPIKRQLDKETERSNHLHREIDRMQSDLDRKVEHETWREFTECTFNDRINQLQKDTQATTAIVNELVNRGVSLETSYRTLSSKVVSGSAAIADDLDTFQKHVENELEKKLDHKEIDISIKEIRHELSCKAWRKDTQAMTKDLEKLILQFQQIQQQVTLSTRFLDWYATRGESYERNLNVVENQLERLAQASAPQLREPFDDQVRF